MKTIITFLLLAAPMLYAYSQPVSFEHTATNANTTNNRTLIDNDAINNDPSAIIAVKKLRKIVDGEVKRNPHKIQVGYDAATGKHYIQNKDNANAMPIGSCYKVVVISSGTMSSEQVTVTKENLPFPNVIEVSNNIFFTVNDRLVATEKDNPDAPDTNDTPFFIGFDYINLDTWNIITTTTNAFSLGTQFNIVNLEDYFVGVHTSPPESIGGYANTVDDFANWTRLNFESINGNPDAGVFAQLYWEIDGSFPGFLIELSTFYNADVDYWEVHSELEEYISDFEFPTSYHFLIYATNPTLNTSESTLIEGIKLFPNPTINDTVIIEAQNPMSEISIFNTLGQKIETISANGSQNIQIDVSNYATGHYVVKIIAQNGIETVRLLKN